MPTTPDLRSRFRQLIAGRSDPSPADLGEGTARKSSEQGRRIPQPRPGATSRQPRLWRPSRLRRRAAHPSLRRLAGSALVQALVAGVIEVVAAFLLASRLIASRFGAASRSDTLAAREMAELGLNEITAQLNTNQYGYLWVTKFRDNDGKQYKNASGTLSWGNVTKADLDDCTMAALDSSGNTIATPGIPAGISSERVIKDTSEGKLSYQVTDFTPPALPDNEDTTTAQSDYCTTPTIAREFGNLSGGTALLTVTGTVTRNGVSTSFKLRRRTHVIPPASDLKYSFMILGDATPSYIDADDVSQPAFGATADIARLNRSDGNICYGTNKNTTCFTTPPLTTTVIGCYELESCLVNNVTSLTVKEQLKNCSVKYKKKKAKGYICNSFQQAGTLPSVPTPTSEGFKNLTGGAYVTSDWGTFSKAITCKIKEGKCNDVAGKEYDAVPPFASKSAPATFSDLSKLKNSDLIQGCYFNNVSAAATSQATSNTTAINCLFNAMSIINADGSKKPNLVFNTTVVPVNIFLHGTTAITLNDGGIDNSATDVKSWQRLRIYGREVATTAGSSVSCSQSSSITSTKGNDINDLFLWLPNAALNYSRSATSDNAYVVVWVCKFTGPTKDKSNNKFSIITPVPEQTIREGLPSTIGPRFQNATGTYRARSPEDTPIP